MLLLFVVCWLLFVAFVVCFRDLRCCSLLFVIRDCFVPFVVVMLCVVRCLLSIVCYPLSLVVCCCVLFVSGGCWMVDSFVLVVVV